MKQRIKLTKQNFDELKKTMSMDLDLFLSLTNISNKEDINKIIIFRFLNEQDNDEIIAKIKNVNEKVSFELFGLNIKNFDTFVFDMDGTLLDSKKNIVPNNLKILNQLRAMGKNIAIATGRAVFMLKNYLNIIPYNLPFLCANGGMVYDHVSFEMISDFNIPKKQANLIMDKADELNLGYYVFWTNGLAGFNVENSQDFKSRDYSKMMEPEHWSLNPGRSFLDDKTICKILVTFDPHQSEDIKVLAQFVEQFKNLIGVQTQKNFFDIGEPSSKALALESIAPKYNIDLGRTVAFGDANNDAPTFDVVALSCAPLNSMTNALEGATFVSDKTSDEDWIYDFIENKLLK
ncbi:HAD family hydrolase [Mycoplasma sp. CSL7475-4]|uniref:HAD family hydrolase n=1 Tax=Mycoplasma sp. CSL7475-4 TaxID=2973942 RepID=UPI00216AC537|nr:HAD family hydrolase [Mycoplasma sp. CSL7475-4]MCS4536777.1 HAD family hydrolase [Mycoplasma sp. CSL7475-4]